MNIRCFIAIEIENQATMNEILKIKRELATLNLDIKPVEDENIHLTIKFLGNISYSSIESIKSILLNISQTTNKFEIVIKGIGAFPSISRPRVVWVGIDKGSEYLLSIRKFIDNEISKKKLSDVYNDELEFKPHITLARMKGYKNIHLLHEFYRRYHDYVFGTSPVTKVKLKQSILRPQGPIYHDIFVVDLK